jgi:hypothetical protein
MALSRPPRPARRPGNPFPLRICTSLWAPRNSPDGLPFTEVPRKRGAHVRNPQLEHVDVGAIGIDHLPLRFSTTVREMKSNDVEEAAKNAPLFA